eukprot:1987116-Rhodomonas_salina.1
MSNPGIRGAESRLPIQFFDEVLLEESTTRGFLRCTHGLGKSLFVDQLQLGAIDPSQTVTAIHECPFVFYPQLRYDAQEQLIKQLSDQGYQEDTWMDLRRKQPPNQALAALFHQVDQEKAENVRLAQKMGARELRYGDVVQLQHVWSREWVSVLREPAELDGQALTIALTPCASPHWIARCCIVSDCRFIHPRCWKGFLVSNPSSREGDAVWRRCCRPGLFHACQHLLGRAASRHQHSAANADELHSARPLRASVSDVDSRSAGLLPCLCGKLRSILAGVISLLAVACRIAHPIKAHPVWPHTHRYAYISKRLHVHLSEHGASLLVRAFKRAALPDSGGGARPREQPPSSFSTNPLADQPLHESVIAGARVVTIRHVEGDAVLVVERGAGGEGHAWFMPRTGAQKDAGAKAFFQLERLATRRSAHAPTCETARKHSGSSGEGGACRARGTDAVRVCVWICGFAAGAEQDDEQVWRGGAEQQRRGAAAAPRHHRAAPRVLRRLALRPRCGSLSSAAALLRSAVCAGADVCDGAARAPARNRRAPLGL